MKTSSKFALWLVMLFGFVLPGVSRAAPPIDADPIAGHWRWFNNKVYFFHPNGSIDQDKGGKIVRGLGAWRHVGPRNYVIDWRDVGWVDTLRLEHGGRFLSGHNQAGKPVTGDRLD
jgi:hypothetical protein